MIKHESVIHIVEENCSCGSVMFACPTCGDQRCLHCDPLTRADAGSAWTFEPCDEEKSA